MPSIQIPGTSITYGWQEREKGWGPGMNTNLLVMGQVARGSVISRQQSAPPVDPEEGDAYLVPAGATGDWSGQDDSIAAFHSGAWVFIDPFGSPVQIEDENLHVYWNGGSYEVLLGTGDLKGPPDSAEGEVAVFSGTTGKVITRSGLKKNDIVTQVANITELRALTGMVDGQVVYMADHTSQGDGGGGEFVVEGDEDGENDDGGTLLLVDGKVVKRVNYNVKSVAMFGASGDGSDQTSSLQLAFSSLADGESISANGRYSVSGQLQIDASDVKLMLHGAEFTQLVEYKKTINFSNPGASSVQGGTFVGKGTEHSGLSTSYNGVAALYFDTPSGVIVDGVHCINHAGGGIRYNDSSGLTVRNSTLSGIGAAGGIVSLDNNGDFAIGSYGSTRDDNVLVTGCDISKHCFGIGASRGSGLRITDNVIHDIPGQHGVYASAMTDIVAMGNIVSNIAGEGIKNQISTSSTDCDGVIVTENAFRNIGGSAIVLGRTSAASNSVMSGVVVDANTINGVGAYFLSMTDCDGVIGGSNEMIGAGGYGLYLNGFKGRVGKSLVKDTQWSAIWAAINGDVELELNVVDACQNDADEADAKVFYGVYVKDGASAVGTPSLTITGGRVATENVVPASLVNSVYTHSNIDARVKGFDNFTGKLWRFNSLKEMNFGYSPDSDFTVSANVNPTTPLYGRGRRVLYGTQDPASASMTDKFLAGDFCYNTLVSVDVNDMLLLGWSCTSGGTPGTWAACYVSTVSPAT